MCGSGMGSVNGMGSVVDKRFVLFVFQGLPEEGWSVELQAPLQVSSSSGVIAQTTTLKTLKELWENVL
jgi:hypothetical protein